MSHHTSSELAGSEEQYQLLGANDAGAESDDHLPLPAHTMGSDTTDSKTEERRGDEVAYFAALVRPSCLCCVLLKLTLTFCIWQGSILVSCQSHTASLTPKRTLVDLHMSHLVHRVRQQPRITGMVLRPSGAPEPRSRLLHLWCINRPHRVHIQPDALSPGILTLQPTARAKTKAAGLQRHQRAMLAVGVPCIALGTLAIEIHKFNDGHPHFTTWHGVNHFAPRHVSPLI